MKTLLLMRHAKSDWDDSGIADHERPLNKRGMKDAPHIGYMLKKYHIMPEWILCSTALRARETAEAVAAACGFKLPIQFEARLYGADPGTILNFVHDVPDAIQRLLVVAHNPGMESLVARLSEGSGDFPTAALAHFEFDVMSWKDVPRSGNASLKALWRPKELE